MLETARRLELPLVINLGAGAPRDRAVATLYPQTLRIACELVA